MSITSKIDIFGNSAPSDSQINDEAFKAIRALYTEGSELRILRSYLSNPADAIAKAHFDAYNTEVAAIVADAAAARVLADEVRAALAYESAQSTITYWQRFSEYLTVDPTVPVLPGYLTRAADYLKSLVTPAVVTTPVAPTPVAPPIAITPAHLAAYHAAVDPAIAIINAATPAILATVAQRATQRQSTVATQPRPFGI